MPDLDNLDKQLLNIIQSHFPMDPQPFARLGEQLEISEAEVIARMGRMEKDRVIRQVSAIFDTRALGYKSTLVATAVEPARLEQAAAIINTHPGVSHNYRRNHSFNIWYTLAAPASSDLETTVDRLHELTGATATRILPTLRLYKIGVELDMTGDQDLTRRSEPVYTSEKRDAAGDYTITPDDIRVIRELQEDLVLTSRPLLASAQRLGMTEEQLLDEARKLQSTGHLRRIAAILYHRRAGYAANGMAVWNVPEDQVMEIGPQMASFSVVSHCYLRPKYEDWQYNIFTMLHGRKVADCHAVAKSISEATGIGDYTVLFSTKEYKKTRVRYFTTELEEWEEKYLGKAVTA